MSPVPKAIDANLLGVGSPVTTTTCGSLPFLFRIKFNASDRAFCALSLLNVHFVEILACKMGLLPLRSRISDKRETVSSTIVLPELIN